MAQARPGQLIIVQYYLYNILVICGFPEILGGETQSKDEKSLDSLPSKYLLITVIMMNDATAHIPCEHVVYCTVT